MTSGRHRPARAGIWTVLWLVLTGLGLASAQPVPIGDHAVGSESVPPPQVVERVAPDGLEPAGGIESVVDGSSEAVVAAGAGIEAPRSAPPERPGSSVIERVWAKPADSLDERVQRTRRASLERGVWNLDSAARAVLLDSNSGLEAARAAVVLAPDLPAGRMALARALWLEAGSAFSAVREAFGSLWAFRRHIEGALWMGGSLLFILSMALMAGGLLAIAVVAGFASPHAAHDLGDLLPVQMPRFGRAALLGVLVLLAMLLGEGLLGLALGLFAIGIVYGTGRQRIMLVLAVCLGAGADHAAGQAPAADGEQVYAMSCARCHDDTLPRMPTRDALRDRSARQIQTAMTSGVMRQFGSALSAAERRAVAEFLSDDPAGTLDSPLPTLPDTAYCDAGTRTAVDLSAPAWNGWGVDLNNRRFQPAESAGMTADTVGQLRLQWVFGFPDVSNSGSQPTVVAGRVLVGTRNGLLYALDAATGCVHWVHEAPAEIRSAVSVGPADGGGFTA